MGDVGIESTLVLDGLAVSKVRFYSTLDSDVGKRVEITDKFNPSNVFTGTFDESLNLLYDLPAFTSYQVKMYGLDGETVESDQSFMLKGYDYLEKNVGLNKNSFAGIKAIVDQGLEATLLQVGDSFQELDNDGSGTPTTFQVVAINYQPETEGYRHNVMIMRKPLLNIYDSWVAPPNTYNNEAPTKIWAIAKTYGDNLPQTIKESITERKITYINAQSGRGIRGPFRIWVVSGAELSRDSMVSDSNSYPTDKSTYSMFPYFTSNAKRAEFAHYKNGSPADANCRTPIPNQTYTYPVLLRTDGKLQYLGQAGPNYTQYAPVLGMMIASDQIE